MQEVAQDYGISDVALAKVCRKLQVPLIGPRLLGDEKCRKAVAETASVARLECE
jgi:hypothetical protein